MSFAKSVLTVAVTVLCCRLVYNNGTDVHKIYQDIRNDIVNIYTKSREFYENMQKTVASSMSTEKERDPEAAILPKKKCKFLTSFDPEEDIGKVMGNIDDIIARGELIVCAKKDDKNLLFQMKTKKGNYVGADVDFAKKIARALGVKLSYRMCYKTYDDVVDAVARREGDIGIAKLSYTSDRATKVLYSSPYAISRKTLLINRVLFENASNETLTTLLNSKDSVIGVTKDTCYEEFVTQIFPKAKISSETDWEGKVMQSIVKGTMVATIRDEVRVKLLLRDNSKLLIKLIPVIIQGEQDSMSAVLNFGSKEFLLWLNKYIAVNEREVNSVDQLIDNYKEYL